jgi:SAM-dependent methyltransferase
MSEQATEDRFHFNNHATLYDAVRPEYPSLLIEDLITLGGVPPGASILDIGCGTGKSTMPFAMREYSVCALDPGSNMLDRCRHNLKGYANVTYECGSFESWNWSGRKFDLVVSGTAFHWVSEAGHKKLSELLQPNGALGIFWHTFLSGSDPIYATINELYKKHAPEHFGEDNPEGLELFDLKRERLFLSIPGFADWRVIRYYTNYVYDSNRYVDLMRTWSTHRNIGEDLFREVGLALDANGGQIIKPIRTTLCLAHKAIAERFNMGGHA